MEQESELPAATRAVNQREREKSRNSRGDRDREGGTDTEFMWFRGELWHLDVIHFTLSRGIHLPPSCNYGALFPLLIHLKVCLCLFLATIRAHTHIDGHTHTHTEHKATLLCNKSLITGSSCFSFSPLLCSGSRSCFPSLCIISFVLLKHNVEPPSPH